MPPAQDDKGQADQGNQKRSLNNLAYWFPILQSTGVPVPRTTIVQAKGSLIEAICDHPCPALPLLIEDLKKAADPFGYPVFLRTGHGSGKHYWKDTCFVPNADAFEHHVLELIEWSELASFIGLPTETWVVREMLQLSTSFEAFHGRLPVNVERRWFFKDGVPVCHHPYWPSEAIGQPSVEDWEKKLLVMNEEPEDQVAFLEQQTRIVAKAFDGAWSLDWALALDGTWYAIDMATARTSFHWEGCENESRSDW